MQNLGIGPALRGHFYGQSSANSPAQILAGKCEIIPASLDKESQAPQFHITAPTLNIFVPCELNIAKYGEKRGNMAQNPIFI